MSIKSAIHKVINSNHLSQGEAYLVANEIMEGQATDAQIAALLVALRLKGETVEEIVAFAKAMREKATKIPCSKKNLVDTCGTGGDQSGTFNISTVSAIVASAAGCNVAKHGNRSVSSQCGSADLFLQLGVKVDISPDQMGRCIDDVGLGFLFAPAVHKAMKYAIGPRREIGIRTIFNVLGPLTNPAEAKRQLLGVFDADLTETIANVLKELGSEHVLVVHGEDGLDEMTLTGKTKVSELNNGQVKNYTIEPEQFGFKRIEIDKVLGGNTEKNAQIALDILNGKEGSPRDIVLLNAGAVIYVGGEVDSIQAGIEKAIEAIDSGKAVEQLKKLQKLTNI